MYSRQRHWSDRLFVIIADILFESYVSEIHDMSLSSDHILCSELFNSSLIWKTDAVSSSVHSVNQTRLWKLWWSAVVTATEIVLQVYQDWLELVNDLVKIWSRSDSDLTQIWLNTLFLFQHSFSFSTFFSFINILFIYIIFFSCYKHIFFKSSTVSEYYINKSFCINLLLYF